MRFSLTRNTLSCAAVGAAYFAGRSDSGNVSQQLAATSALVLTGFLAIAVIVCFRSRLSFRPAEITLAVIALSCATILCAPLLEDDHFRYLWDGFVTATSGRPYAYAPTHYFGDASIPHSMQDVLNGINHPELPTVYGPALQLVFALCYLIAPGQLWPLKLILMGATIGMVRFLHHAGTAGWLIGALVLHPLISKESMISAHPDLLIGMALLWAALLWRGERYSWATIVVSVAVAMKISILPVLPFFWVTKSGRFNPRAIGATFFAATLLYGPHVFGLGKTESQSVVTMGQAWLFNPLLFKVVASVMEQSSARIVIAVVYVLVWSGIALRWYLALRRDENRGWATPPVVAVLTSLLLLSPVVNPWYWLWVLPLATLKFSPVTWVAASVSLLAYSHFLSDVGAAGVSLDFAVPPWATAVQLITIGFAIVCVAFRSKIWRRRSLAAPG